MRSCPDQREMTIEALADRSEIHWTHLSNIEHGKANPSWDVVCRIAVALEVEISDLVLAAAKQYPDDS